MIIFMMSYMRKMKISLMRSQLTPVPMIIKAIMLAATVPNVALWLQ
jgi:hypothetical protein